jgi:hypothetical protein
MSRKSTFTILTALLLFVLALSGLQSQPIRAQGDSDFPVLMEITGTIQALSAKQLTLTDGSIIQITKDTQMPSAKLKAGVDVVIEAEFDTDEFIAHSITIDDGSEESASLQATATATGAATAAPTKGKGKGNGKGNSNENDDDSKGDKPGKGNGNGNGNGKGNGNGNGKGGDDKDDDDKGEQSEADCLKNTTHPVATRLAEVLKVPYAEIMGWHCKGFGFGEIARAYLVARTGKMTVQQVFDARKAGKGWGEILKEAGIDPKDVAPGQIMGKGKGKGKGKDK